MLALIKEGEERNSQAKHMQRCVHFLTMSGACLLTAHRAVEVLYHTASAVLEACAALRIAHRIQYLSICKEGGKLLCVVQVWDGAPEHSPTHSDAQYVLLVPHLLSPEGARCAASRGTH